MDENVNPFAMEPEQIQLIRGAFYFFVVVVAVYIATSMLAKLTFRHFVIDTFILNDEAKAKWQSGVRPKLFESTFANVTALEPKEDEDT
jgi:hypothetical protein